MWRFVIAAGIGLGLLATSSGDLPGGTIPVAFVSSVVTFLGVVLSGKIVVPTFAYNREKERADKWENEVVRLNGVIQDKNLPALEAATAANVKTQEVQQEVMLLLHDIARDRK